MQDNLGLLFTVGMIALLFLMDALARRGHQRRRGEVDERESRRVREPAEGGAGPSEPVAWEAESDWAYLRRFPEASESAGAEEDALEPDVAEGPRARRLPQPDGSVVVAPPAPWDESAPRGERSRPERTRRVTRLRAILRTDSETLRDAVLFREVLGRPLGFRPGPGGWQEPG